MERSGGSNGGGGSYYSVLGIRKDASYSDVRAAYRRLALKWHPDRWAANANSSVAGEAKHRFQQIQEAYTVLSDQGKRSMYDAGFYDPTDEDDKGDSLEDLQKMFVDMVGGDDMCFDFSCDQTAAKRTRCSTSKGNVAAKRTSSRC